MCVTQLARMLSLSTLAMLQLPIQAETPASDALYPTPEWSASVNKDDARSKAATLVNAIKDAVSKYESNNAEALVCILGNQYRVVDKFVLMQLDMMGLPHEVKARFANAIDDPAIQLKTATGPLMTWAQQYDKSQAQNKSPRTYGFIQPESTILSIWTQDVRHGRQNAQSAFELAHIVSGLLQIADAGIDAKTLVSQSMVIFDKEQYTKEITEIDSGSPTRDKAYPAVCAWVVNNMSYFYFHPAERKLKIDMEAREHGIASRIYRESHPWKSDEGPNKTNESTRPVQ